MEGYISSETLFKRIGYRDKCIVVAPLLTDECLCKNYSKEEVQEACVRILKYLCTHYPTNTVDL